MAAEFLCACGEPKADFAGDAILDMASTGMLVLERDQAEQLIEGMTEALDVVCHWRRANELLRRHPRSAMVEFGFVDEQTAFDAAFAEQMAPGRLDRAAAEFPKYIRAFMIAGEASTES